MRAQTVSIKQLHEKTGQVVRQAAGALIRVTHRGTVVAVMANPRQVPNKRRRRVLLPAYATLFRRKPSNDVLADLDAVRGR